MLVLRRPLSASSAAPAALCPRQHAHQHQHQHIRAQPCSVSLSPSCALLHAGTLRARRRAHRAASTLNPGNATAALVEELVKSGPATTPTRVTATGRIVASEGEALGMRITLALRLRSCTGLAAAAAQPSSADSASNGIDCCVRCGCMHAHACAVGDLHGDWRKAIESLRMANVVFIRDDMEIEWCGGDTVVVQLGDVMDRGDHEIGRQHMATAPMQTFTLLHGRHASDACSPAWRNPNCFRHVAPCHMAHSHLSATLLACALQRSSCC